MTSKLACTLYFQIPKLTVLTLQTLTAFLEAVLSKKYPSPSSDIILVLAGLEDVDEVLTDFVGGLDDILRNGRNRK